jgi:hypothetical protein
MLACVAPGTARHEADAGLACQLAIGFRHVGGTRLMAARDKPDAVARIMKRIKHGEIALARHAERKLRTVDLQLVYEDLPAGACLGHEDWCPVSA